MRPRNAEEWLGTPVFAAQHALGAALRQAQLFSCVFTGPPGCGKTTLARLLATEARRGFLELSAVHATLGDLRKALGQAESMRTQQLKAPLLFIDELHRFNKTQQDALLPCVEAGEVVLVGATTEAPSVALRPALRSRLQIIRLDALDAEGVATLLDRALSEPRGYGEAAYTLAADLQQAIVELAEGDGRKALGLLELAVQGAQSRGLGTEITHADLPESARRRQLDYDRDGQWHYDCASAFIKSMRASRAREALYWMQRMLDAGEDPRFLVRRMLIFASEDIGPADPQSLSVAAATAQAFASLGMPEARYALAQCCTHLSHARKSRAVVQALALATEDVQQRGNEAVPPELRNR